MELPVYVDLSLSDVASKVRDGMGDIWTEERRGEEEGGREGGREGKRGRERGKEREERKRRDKGKKMFKVHVHCMCGVVRRC